MKKNLEELKQEFEGALKCNNLEEFKNIQQKISLIMVIEYYNYFQIIITCVSKLKKDL